MTRPPSRLLPIRLFETLRDQVLSIGLGVMLQAGIYPLRKAYHQGRFARSPHGSTLDGLRGVLGLLPPSPPADPFELTPGRVLAYRASRAEDGVWRLDLDCERARIQLSLLAADLACVRLRPLAPGSEGDPFPPPFSYAVVWQAAGRPPVPVELDETADVLWVRTPALQYRVDRARAAISFLDPGGELIHADAEGLSWDAGGRQIRSVRQLLPGEHVYGLGQKTTRLDKRGLSFEMWNRDPPYYRPGDDPIYSNIPFHLGVLDRYRDRGRSYSYGLFVDHSSRGRVDFGRRRPGRTEIEHGADPGGDLHRSYFLYGPAPGAVLDRYTELTGRPTMLPLWALGYHQNRWSYSPESRVREIARQFRARRIPCEAIHLDIDYMDGFRSFTWHPGRFPEPARLIADLHEQGFKVVAMIDPGIKVDRRYGVYRDGVSRNAFCAYPDGKPFGGPVWPGESRWPDFTSPAVRAWWGGLYEGMVDLGVDGFWNDMNEPVVFGTGGDTMPDVVRHDWEGRGADHRTAHNVYGMQMARASAEGVRRLRPDERPLVIGRSVWAGSQRTHTHWLGDNYADWEALHNVPQLVMNMGLSGLGFTGPDTGGFVGTPTPELLVRWNQLGAFTPFFRNHTAKPTADQEPWALGPECERLSRAAIELRYRLLPYLYTALWQSTQTGMPMVRPLFVAFPDDPGCLSGESGFSIDDAFMLGDALLVAPVTEPGRTARPVYLPPGRWVDWWEGRTVEGPGLVELPAPLDRIPLLVRAGSAIPTWPLLQFTGQRPVDRVIWRVFAGTGKGVLYEDDGRTWAFEQGEFRVTELSCAWTDDPSSGAHLSIQCAARGAYAPPRARTELIVCGIDRPPDSVEVDGKPASVPDAWRAKDRTLRLLVPEFEAIRIRCAPPG